MYDTVRSLLVMARFPSFNILMKKLCSGVLATFSMFAEAQIVFARTKYVMMCVPGDDFRSSSRLSSRPLWIIEWTVSSALTGLLRVPNGVRIWYKESGDIEEKEFHAERFSSDVLPFPVSALLFPLGPFFSRSRFHSLSRAPRMRLMNSDDSPARVDNSASYEPWIIILM